MAELCLVSLYARRVRLKPPAKTPALCRLAVAAGLAMSAAMSMAQNAKDVPSGQPAATAVAPAISPVSSAPASSVRVAAGSVTEVPVGTPRSTSAPIPPATRRPVPVVAPATAVPVASASSAPVADAAPIIEIDLFVGESRVLPAPGVARIAVGNGSVLTASALDHREVIVFANAPGASTLFIWNEQGQIQRLKLNVSGSDIARLAREVGAFLSGVKGVRVSSIGDKVIVEGDELADAELVRIDQLAQRYPQIVNFTNRQGWEQMVMLDVKVVEFPVNELSELGMRWNAAGGASIGGIWSPFNRITTGGLAIDMPKTSPISSIGLAGGSVVPVAPNLLSAINLGLGAELKAMAQSGRTTLLAEPQLSARNGAKASFLAGGEVPFFVSTINGPTVQFKPYGVRLDIQPRVDRQGNVRATIETEFSQLDQSVANRDIPGLLVRRTSTEFNVRAGETIVLSGLIQRENATTVDKVPGIGDVPVLGALFRSKRFLNKETELVVFVTPTVVDPRTPALVDRIDKTRERLTDRLGPAPHLTEPLQPTTPATPKAPKAVTLAPSDPMTEPTSQRVEG